MWENSDKFLLLLCSAEKLWRQRKKYTPPNYCHLSIYVVSHSSQKRDYYYSWPIISFTSSHEFVIPLALTDEAIYFSIMYHLINYQSPGCPVWNKTTHGQPKAGDELPYWILRLVASNGWIFAYTYSTLAYIIPKYSDICNVSILKSFVVFKICMDSSKLKKTSLPVFNLKVCRKAHI